jgi:SAM-dependent methyltransferase
MPDVERPGEASYGDVYEGFESALMRQVRLEAYGDQDVGQQSWVTADELDDCIRGLRLDPTGRVLDIGCGPGGPLSYVLKRTGCSGVGLDLDADAITAGRARARAMGLEKQLTLQQADVNQPLGFADRSFDAAIAVDVVLHLPNRKAVFAEVARLLRPGGRFWFTDAALVMGAVSSDEIALRSMYGYTQFVPAGFNERQLEAAGLAVVGVQDKTGTLLKTASGRYAARADHRGELEKAEGVDLFDRQQRFLEMVVGLARRGALARFSFLAERS